MIPGTSEGHLCHLGGGGGEELLGPAISPTKHGRHCLPRRLKSCEDRSKNTASLANSTQGTTSQITWGFSFKVRPPYVHDY